MSKIEIMKICPKCGKVMYGYKGEERACKVCDTIMAETNFTDEEYEEIRDSDIRLSELAKLIDKGDNREVYNNLKETQWEEMLREQYVINSPEYDEALYRKREQDDFEWWINEIRYLFLNDEDTEAVETPKAPKTKRCPKCGGTQFTPVRRKFSLLTGFATNKIDLICNSCGSKVK